MTDTFPTIKRIMKLNIWTVATYITLCGFQFSHTAIAESTYEAVVTVDRVPVRAGVGRTFYAVGTLEKGAKVKVSKEVYGWYRVLPPKGVYSYVRKDAVEVKGGKGTILTNGIRVTAASIEGPGGSYRRQLDLKKGDQVVIAGEDGGYYKIKPPMGTYVYLPPKSLRKAAQIKQQPKLAKKENAKNDSGIIEVDIGKKNRRPEVAAGGTRVTTTANNPLGIDVPNNQGTQGPTQIAVANAESQSTQPDPKKVQKAISEAEQLAKAKADKLAAEQKARDKARQDAIDASERAEKRVRGLLATPIENQPLIEVKAQIQAVLAMKALPRQQKALMQTRLGHVDRNLKLQKMLTSLDQFEQISTKDVEKVEIAPATPSYDYVGRLTISSVFADSTGPKYFRLVDTSGTTIGYIAKADHGNLDSMVGKVVGIVGASELEPELRIKLINVTKVEVFGVMKSKEAMATIEE